MPHYPGAGVGGHCIPVDPDYLIQYAKENGFHHEFLSTARSINNAMPKFTVDQLEAALESHSRSLKDAKVAVLGLSYKPGVGDLRESPSIKIIQALQDRGADVAVHYRYIQSDRGIKRSHAGLPEEMAFFETANDRSHHDVVYAMQGADAIVVATAHPHYINLTADDFKEAGIDIVVDGRNCLNKLSLIEAGISYHGIGR